MQGDDQVFAIVELAAHPFDAIRIDIRRRHLHGRRQVDDQFVVRRWLDDLRHRVADFQCNFEFSTGKAFRRIFEPVAATCLGRHVGDHLGSVGSDGLDAVHVFVEHHAALQFTGRIVEMHDRLVCAFQRLEGAGDQFGPALHQHLQRNVGSGITFFHAPAGEIEIRLRGGGKADFDFLESHVEQQRKHAYFAVMPHRIDERLITIAQIDRTPDRCLFDTLGRPLPVFQVDKGIGFILLGSHRACPHSVAGRSYQSFASRFRPDAKVLARSRHSS